MGGVGDDTHGPAEQKFLRRFFKKRLLSFMRAKIFTSRGREFGAKRGKARDWLV
jgi:hypothetical protein